MATSEQWLTVAEVAEYLKISRAKIEMAQKGQIPCTKVTGQWRFWRQQIDQWMFSRQSSVTAEPKDHH